MLMRWFFNEFPILRGTAKAVTMLAMSRIGFDIDLTILMLHSDMNGCA